MEAELSGEFRRLERAEEDGPLYPASSRSGQDFINLMRVSPGAVFRLFLHGKPEARGGRLDIITKF